jgi:hypothetical protein
MPLPNPEPPKTPETPTYPWHSRFDRTNLRHLLLLFAIFTVGFAGVYAYLTRFNCRQGVKPCGWSENTLQALEDGLYFSIATETTVGYGDFAPHGHSRIFACLQAIGGLCIAGLFVTKLTTGPSGKTKVLVDRMSGAWIEFCAISDSEIRTSLIHIRFEKGLLRYDGINFDETEQPKYLGIFEGSSEPTNSINGSEIWFDYSNLEGDHSAFKSGRTSLCFSHRRDFPGRPTTIDEARKRGTRPYDFFRGFAVDKEKGVVPMFGYRLTHKSEAKLAKSRSYSDAIQSRRSKLVRAWLPVCEHKAHVYAEVLQQRAEQTKSAKL